MNKSPWKWRDKDLELRIYTQPGARNTQLAGIYNDQLKIRLAAPPIYGKANQELIAFISTIFKVSKSQVKLHKGVTSRNKTLIVQNLSYMPAELLCLYTKNNMVPKEVSQ